MVLYNFKTITKVPSAKEFLDVILSKTQRKTPTVCHRGWYIQRIRGFYARKIKFTTESFMEKFKLILTDFPRLDDIHPFYSDLVNVLYSKHHYKLALGQISTAKNLIENVGKDYLRLMKFGDSQYRCKELKRAALGRMATVCKKLNASLGYLEQVRQHLTRLPSIDPSTRTLIITGFPNVGKSSFINKVSKANVDVQPYAFTTKSLFVGHMDYKYCRWQVIDTPGILDHPLEDRNTIEMQAITALAHLHSTVLFFVDISESCGYTIKKQVSLYHSIKPLFANKPLLVVANKTDLRKMDSLDDEDKALIESIAKDKNTRVCPMSNISEEGISDVKNIACDMLLQHRVERKLQSKKVEEIKNRISVTQPTPRDDKDRKPAIPDTVLEMKKNATPKQPRRTLKDVEREHGGAGVFNFDRRNNYLLDHDEWKWDIIPEIMDGKNVADFIDPDIEERLKELEEEEEELERAYEEAGINMENDDDELTEEQVELLEKIRKRQKMVKLENRAMKTNNKPKVPRTALSYHNTVESISSKLAERGVDAEKILRERSKSRVRGRKRTRDEDDKMVDAEEASTPAAKAARFRSLSKNRSHTRSQSRMRGQTPAPQDGFINPKQKVFAEKMEKNQQKRANEYAKKGEGDRVYLDPMPKHLFSGKRGIGGNDRR